MSIACKNCKFYYYKGECQHTENTTSEFDVIHGSINKHVINPREINKNGDCNWFKPKSFFSRILEMDETGGLDKTVGWNWPKTD